MASIHRETVIAAPAEAAWATLSKVADAHGVFAPVLSGCRMESEDVREASFANGMVIRERIIDIDPARMRVAYTVIDGGFIHHSASMQIVAIDPAACRFLWTTDVLPDAAADAISPLMDAGTLAAKQNLEKR